ncbi:uncharacterized protein LOC125653870 [Ostrea edulis]|uniref:uncharacterized protein LOC125653870 n=1 Tax=Ostrea edulis TaxID=37623 RepID=UPI0024AFFCA0|nr:uncharacterized protein LOC125653870 [Ostrea edulis]
MAWKFVIPLFLATCIPYCESTYRSRYRTSYYSLSDDAGFIAGIVVMFVVMLSIPITIIICVKCGLCKPRGTVGAGGVLQSNTLQTTVVPPPGQQYGQPGVSGFGQTQYGGPPPSYGQTMQYGQQNGFGQPVGDQFSYGGQKY